MGLIRERLRLSPDAPIALFSVFGKKGIVDYARKLQARGHGIIASGGTARILMEAGLEIVPVEDITGMDAIMDHQVVTLHPAIHGGLLAKYDNPEHLATLEQQGWDLIDVVVCDPYPVQNEIAANSGDEKVLDMEDIGGPTMISAGAKRGRAVLITVEDRAEYLEGWDNDTLDDAYFRMNHARADLFVSMYRMITARYWSGGAFDGIFLKRCDDLPFCYGQNKSQEATFVQILGGNDPLGQIHHVQIAGQKPSATNRYDMKAGVNYLRHAYEIMSPLLPGIKIASCLKHSNASAAGYATNPLEAVQKMARGDELANFGGSVVTNFEITRALAEAMRTKRNGSRQNFDLVLAPAITDEAAEVLERKTGKCRMYVNPTLAGELARSRAKTYTELDETCGIIESAAVPIGDITNPEYLKSGEMPTGQRLLDLLFAGVLAHGSNSNTIALVTNGQMTGLALGQQARVYAAALAGERAPPASTPSPTTRSPGATHSSPTQTACRHSSTWE